MAKRTNWNRYFGSPEKVRKTRVQEYGDRVSVEHAGFEVADMSKRKYGAWLKSEVDYA